jgi:hypothetical protein
MSKTKLNFRQAPPFTVLRILDSDLNLFKEDPENQIISTGGANRIVNLFNPLDSGTQNKQFRIVNNGPENILLYENNTNTNIIILPKGVVDCLADGNLWRLFVKY